MFGAQKQQRWNSTSLACITYHSSMYKPLLLVDQWQYMNGLQCNKCNVLVVFDETQFTEGEQLMFDTVHGLYAAAIFVSCEKAIVIQNRGACQRIGWPPFQWPSGHQKPRACMGFIASWDAVVPPTARRSKMTVSNMSWQGGLLNYTGDDLKRTWSYIVYLLIKKTTTTKKKKTQADQPKNVRSLCQKTFERYAHLWLAWLDCNVIFKCVATLIVRANSNMYITIIAIIISYGLMQSEFSKQLVAQHAISYNVHKW